MKKVFLSIIITIIHLISYGQTTDSFPKFKQLKTLSGNKFKLFLNENPLTEQLYDEVSEFSQGFAAVKRDSKWCYINTSGVEIIPPTFFECRNFVNGFAIVMDDTRNVGFINSSGQLITQIKYYSAKNFYEGFASVCLGKYPNYKWGFINSKGIVVVPLKYTQVSNFYDGIAEVEINEKVGLINDLGKEISPIIYYRSKNLGNGLASLLLDENDRLSFEGVMNKKGEWIFKKGQITEASNFSNKYLIIEKGANKYGIADHSGNIKIEINFRRIVPLNEEIDGLGKLHLEIGQGFFYINENLECVYIEGAYGAIPCPK